MSTTVEFLNVREAAKQLGLHENTVRNLEQRGVLKAVRLPGSGFRRFLKDDIERMRREMFAQYAPAVEIPKKQRRPTKRRTATPADYQG